MAVVIGYDGRGVNDVSLRILQVLVSFYPGWCAMRDMHRTAFLREYGWQQVVVNLSWLRKRGFVLFERRRGSYRGRWKLGPLADDLLERGLLGEPAPARTSKS